MCLALNQCGKNRNRCAQRLVILHSQTYYQNVIACQKPNQSGLRYRSKSPAEKSGCDSHFQASWVSQPIGCLFFKVPGRWCIVSVLTFSCFLCSAGPWAASVSPLSCCRRNYGWNLHHKLLSVQSSHPHSVGRSRVQSGMFAECRVYEASN